MIDLLTVIGQADVALTQAREAMLHPQLDKGFVASLRMLNKTRGGDSSRFKANRLFHEHLDTVVTRRSKEAKLDGVLASSGRRYTAQGKGGWNKEARWIMCLSINLLRVIAYWIAYWQCRRSGARARRGGQRGTDRAGSKERSRSRSRSRSRDKTRSKEKAGNSAGRKASKKGSTSRK